MMLPEYLIIHNHPDEGIDIFELTREHRAEQYLACKYHYLITGMGQLQLGRPATMAGAHTKGFNDKSLGLCLPGVKPFCSEAQEMAFMEFIATIRHQYPTILIRGANELTTDTKSPGFSVNNFLIDNGITP